MQLQLDELSQTLAEEYRQYERLFAMSRREQESLVANDTGSLDRTLMDVREVLASVQALSERRAMLVSRIADLTGISQEALTLTRLREMARGITAVRLERLEKEFRELMRRLHKLNGTNLLLIRNSLDMNDRSARLILGETGQVQFYGEAGEAETAPGPRLVSRRM